MNLTYMRNIIWVLNVSYGYEGVELGSEGGEISLGIYLLNVVV